MGQTMKLLDAIKTLQQEVPAVGNFLYNAYEFTKHLQAEVTFDIQQESENITIVTIENLPFACHFLCICARDGKRTYCYHNYFVRVFADENSAKFIVKYCRSPYDLFA